MKKPLVALTVATLLVIASVAHAQPVTILETQQPAKALVPLRVQVVISKYRDDKKTSSMPYTLSINANERNSSGRPYISSLRIVTQVPVPAVTFAGENKSVPVSTFNYRDIGTSIDASATTTDDGRYRLELTVEDSTVSEGSGPSGPPPVRTVRTSQVLFVRDGQAVQYTSGADKTNGEIIRIEVTVTALK